MTARARKLVVDLRATSPAWCITPGALDALMRETPPGWLTHVASSATSSDGDGGGAPSGELLGAMAGAEVYFGFGISRELFLAAPRLRWIHSASAGVGSVLFDEIRSRPVLLTNSAGIYGPPIAEHVLAGVLHFLRCFDIAAAAQLQGVWAKGAITGDASLMRELAGSRVLIIGTGGIGSEIARRMTMLGAECIGIRRRTWLGTPEGFQAVHGPDALDAELSLADLVILAAPATGETARLLDARRIALLGSGAIVVNVSRGSLLDEEALAVALREGRIRGAMLDVASREPPPPDSPLWRTERLLLTPHVSGVAPRSFWLREMELFLENWRRYTAGLPLRNLVDKQAGY